MFQPGVSGNPGGKPKASGAFRKALLSDLMRRQNVDGRLERRLTLVARKVVDQAIAGDVFAAKEIAQRIDGKVPDVLIGDAGAPPVRLAVDGTFFALVRALDVAAAARASGAAGTLELVVDSPPVAVHPERELVDVADPGGQRLG